MYVGMDKRLFRLGESICGLFRGAHIDSQALKHSSTLDIVYSTLRFKWSIYCPFRVLLSANSLVQLVLRLPQFIPLSKRPLSGCRTSEFRFTPGLVLSQRSGCPFRHHDNTSTLPPATQQQQRCQLNDCPVTNVLPPEYLKR